MSTYVKGPSIQKGRITINHRMHPPTHTPHQPSHHPYRLSPFSLFHFSVVMANDPIQQMLKRLQAFKVTDQPTQGAYTILVQSSQSLAVRQALTKEEKDAALYRKAGVRTPRENAHRDWFGAELWWQRLLRQLAATASPEPPSQAPLTLLLYIQTLPTKQPVPSEFTILDLTTDPWGWDAPSLEPNGDKARPTPNNLSSLQSILEAVQQKTQGKDASTETATVVMDSLAPLCMRHGLTKLLVFLQRLQHLPRVSTLLLRDAQPHGSLPDLVHAWLLLKDGQTEWIHQGIRERDNMIRQTIDFVLEEGDTLRLVATKESSPTEPPTTTADNAVDANPPSDAILRSSSTSQPSSGRPRVQLKLEEDGSEQTAAATAATTAPRIFMQEDDPEFDDFDEEDPDDDLDI